MVSVTPEGAIAKKAASKVAAHRAGGSGRVSGRHAGTHARRTRAPGRTGGSGGAGHRAGPSKPSERGAAGAAAAARGAGRTGRAARRAVVRMPRSRGHAGNLILAEFVACLVLLLLGAITGASVSDPKKTGAVLAIRGSALAGVFFVLALVSTGGRSAAKLGAAFGGVITLAYMINDRAVITTIGKWAKSAKSASPAGSSS